MLAAPDAVMRAYSQHLAGSLVYLDAGAAEAVAAGIGLAAVQEQLGAAAVCDLSAVSTADLPTAALLSGSPTPIRKVSLLVTTLLREAEAAVLAACHLSAAAAQFTVLCCVSEAAHHDEMPALYGPRCFASLASAWQQELNEARLAAGSGPCSLEVRRCPLPLCPVTSTTFVLPAAAAAAALPRAGRLAAGFSTTAAAAAGDESDDEQQPHTSTGDASRGGGSGEAAGKAAGLSLLAHALVDAVATLGFRPEAFSLGPCSRLVCRSMAFVPAAPGDLPPAALVLVDRLLDPVSPSLHPDLLLPRIFDCLQPASTGSAGGAPAAAVGASGSGFGGGAGIGSSPFAPVCVELAMPSLDPLLAATVADASSSSAAADAAGGGAAAVGEHGSGVEGSRGGQAGLRGPHSLLPGSLWHPEDPQARRWLEFLLSRKGRDGPLFIRKWLREAARKENAPQPKQRFKPGTICVEELRSLADALPRLSPATACRHAALLQLAEGAAAAIEGRHADHWEALQREERQLLFACSESPQAAAAQLVELCRLAGRPTAPLRLPDVVLLLLSTHCLLPGFHPWLAGGEGIVQPFQPQQEAQLREALAEAVMASGEFSASNTADSRYSSCTGGSDAGSSGPAFPLDRLARRVAAAKAKAKAAAGAGTEAGSGGIAGGTGRPVSEAGAAGAAAAGAGAAAEEDVQALRLEAWEAAGAVLERCRELAGFRQSQLRQQQQLAQLAGLGQDGAPRHSPLLRRVVDAILQGQALPDLHAGATSLSGLLRSGLGRFGLQAGPKPSDCGTVILFVVGGISLAELHEIMEAVDSHAAQLSSSGGGGDAPAGGGGAQARPSPRVLVGATALLRPADMAGHLFADLSSGGGS